MSHTLSAILFTFKTRLSRSPFWWCCIGLWISFAVLFVFLESSLGRASTWILYPPFIWMLAALMVKRLHDRGSSAWQLLWLVVPAAGPLWLIITTGFRKGTEGDNQYGPDPLLVNVDYLRVNTP